jgi:mitochondrial distribution and morphology protein 31
MEGPISWIKSGKVDAVLDLKIPPHPEDGMPLNAILEEIADVISTSLSNVTDPALERIPGLRELAKPPLVAPEGPTSEATRNTPSVTVDIDLRFRDVKAVVPMFTRDLSYVNHALIRPIVAFIK